VALYDFSDPKEPTETPLRVSVHHVENAKMNRLCKHLASEITLHEHPNLHRFETILHVEPDFFLEASCGPGPWIYEVDHIDRHIITCQEYFDEVRNQKRFSPSRRPKADINEYDLVVEKS
jgi:hypothetical protein